MQDKYVRYASYSNDVIVVQQTYFSASDYRVGFLLFWPVDRSQRRFMNFVAEKGHYILLHVLATLKCAP